MGVGPWLSLLKGPQSGDILTDTMPALLVNGLEGRESSH